MRVLSCDLSYRHSGLVLFDVFDDKKNNIIERYTVVNKGRDMAKSYSKYYHIFSDILGNNNIEFVIIDGTYIPSGYGMYAQKYNFGVVALLLSLLVEEQGYILYSMNQVYSYFNIPPSQKNKKLKLRELLKVKPEKTNIYEINKDNVLSLRIVNTIPTEDIIDSIALLIAFVNRGGKYEE